VLQVVARNKESEQKKKRKWGREEWQDEYGVISASSRAVRRNLSRRGRPQVEPEAPQPNGSGRPSSSVSDVADTAMACRGSDMVGLAGTNEDGNEAAVTEKLVQDLAKRISEPLMREITALREQLEASANRVREI
jgi:hypothetical protein